MLKNCTAFHDFRLQRLDWLVHPDGDAPDDDALLAGRTPAAGGRLQ